MAKKLRKKTASNVVLRTKRHWRKKKKLTGSSERPRLAVFRSNKNVYAQIIDDSTHKVLCQASTIKSKSGHTADAAAKVGDQLAKVAVTKNITKVVFDNSGYKFHGRVKSLAEAARKGGLSF